MHFAVARSQVLAGCLLEIISFLPHGPLHGEAYITSNFSRASQQERKRTGGHKSESGREREREMTHLERSKYQQSPFHEVMPSP